MSSNATPKKPFKWVVLTIGTLFGVAHIGILGHVLNAKKIPIINLPVGDYTSYSVEADRDGYKIDYSSNDPKVIEKKKTVDKENGFLGIGGRTTVITDEEYTMGGQEDNLGKSNAKREECIKAAGGGQSTGRIVGASMGAAAAPLLTNIPYVGWVAAGWIAMFGQDQGAEIGGELATSMMDCE